MPAGLDIRLRVPTPGLLGLPWADRLADWDATEVPLRDIAVGPSRHLVRFVESDGGLWALKELPPRIAQKEFGVLRELESRGLAAIRPAGVVGQASADTAILVTRFLQPSWQYGWKAKSAGSTTWGSLWKRCSSSPLATVMTACGSRSRWAAAGSMPSSCAG